MLKNEERLKQPISSSPRDGGGWGMGVWVGTQQLLPLQIFACCSVGYPWARVLQDKLPLS